MSGFEVTLILILLFISSRAPPGCCEPREPGETSGTWAGPPAPPFWRFDLHTLLLALIVLLLMGLIEWMAHIESRGSQL